MATLKIKDANGDWIFTNDISAKAYIDYKTREVELILDDIIAVQNSLMGGEDK